MLRCGVQRPGLRQPADQLAVLLGDGLHRHQGAAGEVQRHVGASGGAQLCWGGPSVGGAGELGDELVQDNPCLDQFKARLAAGGGQLSGVGRGIPGSASQPEPVNGGCYRLLRPNGGGVGAEHGL